MANNDAYQLSTFFHKDRNGKLRAGSVWDFNLSGGNQFNCGQDGRLSIDWYFNNADNNGSLFWINLFLEPTFKCYMAKRWKELNAPNQVLSFTKISNVIDSISTLLAEAKVREQARWGASSFCYNSAAAVDFLKDCLSKRIDFLNVNLVNSGCSYPNIKPLVISKIHYNPLLSGAYSSNDLEFIELTNNSNSPIDVSGYYFRELGLTYIFPNNSIIPSNGIIYLAASAAKFTAFYSYTPFGEYSRNLSNTSEKLILADAFGNTVDSVQFENTAPWPTAANGTGAYLKLKGLNYDNALASSWVSATTNAVSTEEIIAKGQTTLYPNPTTEQITLSGNQLIFKYEIYDQLGRLVQSESNIQSEKFTINLHALESNTYILKTTANNQGVNFFKVIKY